MINLTKKFEEMGARVKIGPSTGRRQWNPDQTVRVDVLRDKDGEYFDLRIDGDPGLQVLDLQKKDRHLLLLAREPRTQKFLCGHDERHWFACAVPEKSGASSVSAAKQALKPAEVVEAESKGQVRSKDRHKHHRRMKKGGKIHRQGEFMFLPEPNFKPGLEIAVLKKEPMQRGAGSSPHMAEYLYRTGGETVHVSGRHSNGITETEFKKLPESERKGAGWRIMKRDANVYTKGKIRHKDHATLDLGNVWHKVVMNTENQAWAARNVAFLD